MKITLENCGKSFNRKWLFKNVDCTLQAGEKWAILGSNGSGKSTFCLMLCGQVWPTEGNIQWLQEVAISPDKVYALIALASPALELPEEFNFNELIEIHKTVKPFSTDQPKEAIAALCGFDQKTMSKALYTYSSGMKQRAKLALAALSQTPILLLDEPLTNLDRAGSKVYENIITQYCSNRLVVIASNREEEYDFCENKMEIHGDGSASFH